MKKTIYLHVGSHKTASTAIQKYCNKNYKQLKRKGILYPMPRDIEPYFSTKYKQRGRVDVNNNVFINGEILENSVAVLKGFIDGYTQSNIIFSEENIMLRYDKNARARLQRICENLASLQTWYNIKIICYIREIVSFYISEHCYRSSESHQEDNTFFSISDRNYQDYYHALSSFAKIVSKNNTIVRPFIPSSFRDGEISNDFFDIIAPGITEGLSLVGRLNSSLSLKQAEKLYYVNQRESDETIRFKCYTWLKNTPPLNHFTITQQELDWVYDTLHEYELKIIREFLGKNTSEEVFGDNCYEYWKKKTLNAPQPNNRALTQDEKQEIRDVVIMYRYETIRNLISRKKRKRRVRIIPSPVPWYEFTHYTRRMKMFVRGTIVLRNLHLYRLLLGIARLIQKYLKKGR